MCKKLKLPGGLTKNKQPLLIIFFTGLLLVGAIGSVIVDKINSIQLNSQKTEVINSAQKLFDVSDFESAKSIIQEGLKIAPEDVELKSFLSKVSNVIVSNDFYSPNLCYINILPKSLPFSIYDELLLITFKTSSSENFLAI